MEFIFIEILYLTVDLTQLRNGFVIASGSGLPNWYLMSMATMNQVLPSMVLDCEKRAKERGGLSPNDVTI